MSKPPVAPSRHYVTALPTASRRIRVEQIMGTAIGIDLRDLDVSDDVVQFAFELLREADARFSTFKAESEISRLGRGEMTLDECHPDVAAVLAMCEDLRKLTHGVFNAWGWRTDGRLDPSGLVKGWAAERSARILERAGARNFCINAGGDVLVRGEPEPGRPWRVGIRHPTEPTAVAAVLSARDLAVATSGSYERGDHVIDPRTGVAQRELVSLTVAGPSLTLADAYATAAFAMGGPGLEWVAAQPGYASYAITTHGRVHYTAEFAELLNPQT